MRPTYAQERLHEAVVRLGVSTAPLRKRLRHALQCAERARYGPGLDGRQRGELEALLSVAGTVGEQIDGTDPCAASLAAMSDVEVLTIADTLIELSSQLARVRFAPTPASIQQTAAAAGLDLNDLEF